MKRTLLFLLFTLVGILLTACAGTPGTGVETPGGGDAETAAEAVQDFTLDQLVATDPGTVQLASGKVQLVEFFAYW